MISLCVVLASVLVASHGVEAKAPYCLAGAPCFPPDSFLRTFNASIGGKLIKATPYGSACYKSTYDAEKCQAIAKEKSVAEFRVTLPAAVQYSNFELTDNLAGCPVPDLKSDGSAPDPVDAECTLGAMPHYVVNATCADDVAKAVKFAAKYNLRLRIKNTGHDYTGRSSGEGSFSIWTHYMNEAEFVKDFTPTHSSASPHDVISAGPGVDVLGLYSTGAANGVVTIGGFSPTVGACGGYVLGGGTGPFAPQCGLGVDNVVQFEVVTADGKIQIANEAVNSDLFWALRGGGGAFAVTTRVYLKAYPAYHAINTVGGGIVCENKDSYSNVISAMVDLQLPLRDANQSGIWETDPETLSIAVLSFEMFLGGVIKPANDTLKAFAQVSSVTGCNSTLQGIQISGPSAWIETYKNVVIGPAQAGGRVGVALADMSRTISYKMVQDQSQRDNIKKFITDHPVPFIWQNAVGGASRSVSPKATAVHPGFRDAFAFMDTPIFGPWTGFTNDLLTVINQTNEALTDTFGNVAYYNEQYGVEENWQDLQFGSNYPRLLRIKKAVDPNGVFSCYKCVGSEAGY